jgi:Uma2 family endonuclease
MSVARSVHRYTPEEYYALERAAAYKSEYYQGEIFAMAGNTSRHSLIAANLIRELGVRLKGNPCAVYDSNQRLKITATGLRTYPDVSVYCGKLEYDVQDPYVDTATNATIVFEILSDSTEAYDRGTKAQNYRQIESLRAYALISQDKPFVEVHQRQSIGKWELQEAVGFDAIVHLPEIGVDLPLSEIYDRVTFGPETSDGAPLQNSPKP